MLQHSRAMYSISYIRWLQLAAEYEGCSQLILTSPLRIHGISISPGSTKQALPHLAVAFIPFLLKKTPEMSILKFTYSVQVYQYK